MDIRSYTTKNRIMMALIECIKEKPYDSILNKDIVEKAQISSRTFYHYYSDKNEILAEIEQDILTGLKEANEADFKNVTEVDHFLTDEDNIALAEKEFKHLIDYCSKVKDVANVLLSPNGDINFLSRVNKIATEETQRRLDFLFENNFLDRQKKSEIPAPIVINIVVSAIVTTVLTWLRSDTELSPYQVRKILGEVQVKSPTELLLLLKK